MLFYLNRIHNNFVSLNKIKNETIYPYFKGKMKTKKKYYIDENNEIFS